MFIPISDNNPLRHLPFQYVTVALIAVTTLAHFAIVSGALGGIEAGAVSLGVIPAVLTHQGVLPPEYVVVPETLTLLTYQFVHGGWMHLAGNMLFLWVFGDNVEDAMGHARFLAFYLLCGVGAALLHAVMLPDAVGPLVGANG